MKKKTIALALAILCILQSSAFASTPVQEEQEAATISLLRYEHLVKAIPRLTVSGTAASYSLSVTGSSAVTSISTSLQLQRYVGGAWSSYGQSWPASTSGNSLRTSGTKEVPAGASWLLMATITLYTTNGSSTEVVYS